MTPVDLIFARTRHTYDSYADFWALVHLAGFRTVFVDEMQPDQNATYITSPFTGEITHHLSNWPKLTERKCQVIWWNLERPDVPGNPHITAVMDQAYQYVNRVWVSDRWYAGLESRMQHVVLGGHPDLCTEDHHGWNACIYDFAHTSYGWGRRADLYARCRNLGLREMPPGFGHERNKNLARTRLMLNAQQYPDAQIVAPLRFALAASAGLPIVSEPLNDPYPLILGESVVQAPMLDLPAKLQQLLQDPLRCSQLVQQCRAVLHEDFTFQKCVLGAV